MNKKSEMTKSDICNSPVGRIAYPWLDEPDARFNPDKPKYKITLIWDKASGEAAKLKKVCTDIAKAQWGDSVDMTTVLLPITDGSEREGQKGFGESVEFATFKSSFKPEVFNLKKVKIGEAAAYAGSYGRVTYKAAAYKAGAQKGVTLYLSNVQFVRDGEPLTSGGVSGGGFDDEVQDSSSDLDSAFG